MTICTVRGSGPFGYVIPLRWIEQAGGTRVVDCLYTRLAQLVAHIPYKDGVTGSSPVPGTKDAHSNTDIFSSITEEYARLALP